MMKKLTLQFLRSPSPQPSPLPPSPRLRRTGEGEGRVRGPLDILKRLLFILMICMATTHLAGCGTGGTDTGNPTTGNEGDTGGGGDEGDEQGSNEPSNEPAGQAAQTGAGQILEQICTKLTECYTSLEYADCETGVLAVESLEDNLGLASGSYATYQDVVTAEQNGEITYNSDSLTQCLTDIDALTCSLAAIQSAYDESDPDNFNNVGSLVPMGTNSCEGVY